MYLCTVSGGDLAGRSSLMAIKNGLIIGQTDVGRRQRKTFANAKMLRKMEGENRFSS